MIQISTKRDMWRHTAIRMAVAVGLTLPMVWVLITAAFGADMNVRVRVGDVIEFGLIIAALVAALLSAVLTYRSAGVMRELSLTRAKLLRLSRTDQLTGLWNRRGFDEMAGAVLKDAAAQGRTVTAMMCDIDHFKAINDTFGHDLGDRVLARIATTFRAFADTHDMLVARHGGEEFAFLAVDISDDEAAMIADQLRRSCEAQPVADASGAIQVTVSVGFVRIPGEFDLSRLMRAADDALYVAKSEGRNRVFRSLLSPPLAA